MNQRQAADTWERGDPYERYVGRWSRQIAPRFLAWLNLPPGRRWLDVGCGTGALCGAILDTGAPASLTGIEPSEGFLRAARQNLGGRATLLPGNATALPLESASVEVVVSGLVLNFIPDVPLALGEMARVIVPGGTIGAYVWDYAGKMELMRYFWDAAVELDPDAVPLDEGVRFPLCQADALRDHFENAGLNQIDVAAMDIPTVFADFEDYWQPFLGGQGPAPAYVASLDDGARTRLRNRLRERLPFLSDGTLSLTARAWAVRGTVLR